MKKIIITVLGFCFMLQVTVHAQGTAQKQPSTEWFREAKYGLFLHFGLYSVPAGIWKGKKYYGISEWVQRRAKIPVKEYELLAKEFNPVGFNADSIVRFAKENGFRYIVFGAKFHDGFAMFKSKASAFNIVDATPYKKDPIKELADACKKQGMKLGFYYSQSQDWYEADAIGNDWDFAGHTKNFKKYLEEKCKPQLEELLTSYGEVSILWFDTPQEITKEESQYLVDWVHKLQPNCLTTSRVGHGLGDYIALQDHQLPTEVIVRPFEALFTHNESWGYSSIDKNFRTPREVLKLLIESNTKGGNLIFNISPDANGMLQAESVADASLVGAWLRTNGEGVYGTGASPFPELTWGGCTSKPGQLFLHVMDMPADGWLRLPSGKFDVSSVKLLAGGKLAHVFDGEDMLIDLRNVKADPLANVIKITYKGKLQPPQGITMMGENTVSLVPAWSSVAGKATVGKTRWMEEFGDWHYANYIDEWQGAGDSASWMIRLPKEDRYWVVLEYNFETSKKASEGIVRIGDQELRFIAQPTGDDKRNFYEHRIGMIALPERGVYNCSVSPTGTASDFIKLRTVKLIPYR